MGGPVLWLTVPASPASTDHCSFALGCPFLSWILDIPSPRTGFSDLSVQPSNLSASSRMISCIELDLLY